MEVEGGSAEKELERRSNFLNSLIKKKKATEQEEQHDRLNVRVRASDMPISLQDRAFACARCNLDSMSGKLDNKSLALALKKVTSNKFYLNLYLVCENIGTYCFVHLYYFMVNISGCRFLHFVF